MSITNATISQRAKNGLKMTVYLLTPKLQVWVMMRK